MLPEFAIEWHLAARGIVGDRHAGQFDDAALDGVDEREVAHRPRKQGALQVARAAQKERRCRQVVDRSHAHLALQRFDPRDPQPRGFGITLGLLAILGGDGVLVRTVRLLTVAMVRLVVDHDEILDRQQLPADALEHRALGLDRVDRRMAALEKRAPNL